MSLSEIVMVQGDRESSPTRAIVEMWLKDDRGILVIPYQSHVHYVMGLAESLIPKVPVPSTPKKRTRKKADQTPPEPLKNPEVERRRAMVIPFEDLEIWDVEGPLYLLEVKPDDIPFWMQHQIIAYSPGRI